MSLACDSLDGRGEEMATMKIARTSWMWMFVFVLSAVIFGCKRAQPVDADSNGSSLIFGTASPEAQQALATPVDFRLTEENFVAWEAAQKNLDALPRSALPSGESSAGNPIDRAVERLESSPRARTAIERTGLSVRDFVLETIALAQATEALATANSSSTGQIPPENLQFVQAHRSRMLLAQRRRQAIEDAAPTDVGTQPETTVVEPVTPQPADLGTTQSADSAGQSGAPTEQRSEQRRSEQRLQQHDTLPPAQVRQPQHDSARDTIPPP
jgi:hypothetical protein